MASSLAARGWKPDSNIEIIERTIAEAGEGIGVLLETQPII